MKVLNFDGTIYEARPGTASQPGISFAGDPNTGIYSPGADQLAISTNGTPRLLVDASGNVSINTAGGSFTFDGWSNDRTVLQQQFSSQYYQRIGFDAAGRDLRIQSNSGDSTGKITFWTGATGTLAERLRLTSTGTLNFVGAGTAGSTQAVSFNGSAPVNSLVIDSTGRIGVNTASPVYPLHVNGNIAVSSGNGIYLGTGQEQYITSTGTSLSTNLVFQRWTGSSYMESVRLDSSGRLLVGTSSAVSSTYAGSGQLQTHNDGVGAAQIFTHRSTGSEYPAIIELLRSRGSLVSPSAVIADDKTGAVVFHGYDGSNYIRLAAIDALVDGTPGANDMPGRLVFSTTADGASSPTERMRIQSTGRSMFTMNTGGEAVALFDNTANTSTDQGIQILMGSNAIVGTARFITCAQKSVADRLIVYGTGNVVNTNNSYGAISDIKLKENIVDANSQWNDLKALQVRNYNFKEGQTHTQIGLIAQEVELVSPGLVTESPDRDEDGNDLGTVTKSVNYSVLYMKAVKALQEAMERIETLEAKVAALESI